MGESPRQSIAKPARTIELSSCQLPDVVQTAKCGALSVLENPDRPAGRRLSIGVAVVPARGGRSHSDPIVVLMGGPGEDAIGSASMYAQQFAPLLQDRDLLLVDQRGTGRSGALHCDLNSPQEPGAVLRDLFPPAAVKQCEERLRAQADLTQYGYPRFADDLERVRRALRFGPMNLFAGSYGTRAAQVYLRTYPQGARTVYLASPVPIDVATPLAMAKTAETALQRLFSECAADTACNTAFPNLREEFRQIFARLESGGVQVSIPHRAGTVPLSRGRVAEWIRAKLYRPKSASILPWVVHRAYAGDWNPIADDIVSADNSDFSFGLLFAITCSEDVAFLRAADILPQTQGTFLGDDRIRQQQAACEYWPKAPLPRGYRTLVHSSAPTLLVTGDADGGTPLWYTEHVARGFSNAVEVVIGGQGHTEWNDCLGRLYERLVRSGSLRDLGSASCTPIQPPPFKTS
jgi:pimeloyl-ACP methyl ester carboxylesterase